MRGTSDLRGELECELQTVGNSEATEDLGQLSFDCGFADVQLLRDVFIAGALRNKLGDLTLACYSDHRKSCLNSAQEISAALKLLAMAADEGNETKLHLWRAA